MKTHGRVPAGPRAAGRPLATRPGVRVAAGLALPLAALLALAPPGARAQTQSATDTPAAPVIDTSVPFLPGAREVYEDTPSAFVWSRYQVGERGAWSYRLFPDGSGLVAPAAGGGPLYTLACSAARDCTITGSDGSREALDRLPAGGARPPATAPGGPELARSLAQWVLARTGMAPGAAPAEAPEPPPLYHAPRGPLVDVPARLPRDPDSASAGPAIPPLVALAPLPEDDPPGALPQGPGRAVDTGITQSVAAPLPPPIEDSAPLAADAAPAVLPPPLPPAAGPIAAIRQTLATPRLAPERPPIAPADAATEPAPLRPAPPGKPRTLAERFSLSCSISSGMGLEYSDPQSGGTRFGKLSASIGCGMRLGERLSLRGSLIGYPITGQRSSSDASFTFALAYRLNDWLTLNYANYTARGNVLKALGDGGFSLSARIRPFTLPLIDRRLDCSGSMGLPFDALPNLGLSCGVNVTPKFSLRMSTTLYAPGQQGDYAPDFTYVAGYQINPRTRIEYSNYSNNRWPWNKNGNEGRGLLGGGLRLSYQLKF